MTEIQDGEKEERERSQSQTIVSLASLDIVNLLDVLLEACGVLVNSSIIERAFEDLRRSDERKPLGKKEKKWHLRFMRSQKKDL